MTGTRTCPGQSRRGWQWRSSGSCPALEAYKAGPGQQRKDPRREVFPARSLSGGLITEDIIKLEVGDSQTVQGAVLLPGEHVRELGAVAHQVAELPYFRRWDKAGLYHVAHEEVADPLCILAVSLIALLWLRIFWMGKRDETGFFEDVEDRNPILASREAGLLILGATIGGSDTDAGIDPGLVDIKSTTVFTKDFKRQQSTS